MKKEWDFWIILSLLLVIIGFMFSMNVRMDSMNSRMDSMATKTDLARVENDIREIRGLIINHINNSHSSHTHKKSAKSDFTK